MRAFAAILGLFMMLGGVGIYAYYDSQVRPDKEARELLVEARIGFEKAYGSKDEISNSIDLFSKIIAKYPGTKAAAEAYFYIGHGYEKLGLKRLAYLKYVYALKNNRHRNDALDGEVRTRIARLRLERNYNAEGIHQLLSVIGNSDDKNFRGRGYTELGHAYLKQGKFDEARRMFDTALMEDGDNEDAILAPRWSSRKLARRYRLVPLMAPVRWRRRPAATSARNRMGPVLVEIWRPPSLAKVRSAARRPTASGASRSEAALALVHQ
jgi:tetratricopeptide (TPR) repeat protein